MRTSVTGVGRSFLLLCGGVALPVGLFWAPAAAQAPPDVKLTPERVFADPDLSGPRARGVRVSPDGSAVTFLKAKTEDQRVTDLWIADVAGGPARRLVDGGALTSPADGMASAGTGLSEIEKSRRERQGVQTRGVVEYSWDDTGDRMLIPVEGALWLYGRANGAVTPLVAQADGGTDARLSPKGTFAAFVRDDNLWVVPASGGPPRALTTGGDTLHPWGEAEFVAQEEMGRKTGYWISPDERRVALTHTDLTGVDVVPRFDIGADGATVVDDRYPRAGRPNAKVELFVEGVADGTKVKVDLGSDPDFYLARVDWARDASVLYVQRQTRDQRRLDLLLVDPATGRSRLILSQTSPHWVELSDDFRPLKDGDFLWTSEEGGWRHIRLYRRDGALARQVTAGPWPVAQIVGADEADHTVIFAASKDSPTERRLYAVSYGSSGADAGGPTALTSGGGWWSGDLALNGKVMAATYEDPATPPRTGLYDTAGHLLRWVEENHLGPGHPFWPYASRMGARRFGTIKAADGEDLWWSMRTPPNFDPKRRYPVIVQVYGGPAAALVRRGWANPADQLLLEAGYILFSLDNRGTPNRSVAFKTAIDRRLGQLEVEDQIAGARFLDSLPFVDGKRIGVTGWSNGGFMTLMLLTAPSTPFAAGVAGAPPTDWTLYDTHYTERYLGTPAGNPAGYAAADILPRLGSLKPGDLLLLHGMADDNVVFENSTRIMAGMQSRAIAFETMLYPGLRHRAGWTQADLLHRTRATLDFFARKLGGAE